MTVTAAPGFSLPAVKIMQAMNETENGAPIADFVRRCRRAAFWALLDDGEPCGGVVIENSCIHVSSRRPCGLAVRRVVREWLIGHGVLFTAIRPGNERARRLAIGLGFSLLRELEGFAIYWRRNT